MRKIGLILFALTSVIFCEGCRRNVVKRDPVLVNKEADYIYTRNTGYLLKKFTPPPKQPDGVPGEVDQKLQEAAQKAKEEADKKKKLDNFDTVADQYVKFIRKEKPINQSTDKFKMFVRRAGLHDLRFEEIDPGQIKSLFLLLNNKPGHVVLHRTQQDNNAYAVYEVAGNNPIMPLGLTSLNEGALAGRVKRQELEAMLYHVWEFSKSYYVNKPADPQHAARMNGYLGNFVPWAGLNGIRTDVKGLGVYLKKTPEKRDYGKFRRYLIENAPPDFIKALDDNRMRVTVASDLADPAQLVACQVETEGKDRGSLAITSSGNVSEYAAATINQWFPAQKKDQMMMMVP